MRLSGTNIDLYIYPAYLNIEDEISAKDYEEFFLTKRDESRIAFEPLFPAFLDDEYPKFKRFDFVFSDSSGNTINDLIEISGIEKVNFE